MKLQMILNGEVIGSVLLDTRRLTDVLYLSERKEFLQKRYAQKLDGQSKPQFYLKEEPATAISINKLR